MPDGDPGAMRYAVRTHLPMIQVPIATGWSYPGNPRFTPADLWLDTSLPTATHLPDLVKRFLAAFGPASAKDMQTWSYLADLQPVFDALRSDLCTASRKFRVLYEAHVILSLRRIRNSGAVNGMRILRSSG